jgi:hypothetical protein
MDSFIFVGQLHLTDWSMELIGNLTRTITFLENMM